MTDILSLFKDSPDKILCASCSNLLSIPPIVYDSEAKVYYCGRCKGDKNESLERAEMFETFAKAFVFPCQYHKHGCTHKYDFQSGKQHENFCEFRLINCPFHITEKCQWSEITSKVKDHLLQVHLEHKVDLHKFKIKINNNFTLIKYDIASEKVFILKIEAITSEKKCWIEVCHIGDPSETCQMIYNTSIHQTEFLPGRQIEITRQMMKNYSTGVVDRRTMEEIDTTVLEKFFTDTNLWLSIKIIHNDAVLQKHFLQLSDSKILSELECPICQEFMLKNIFICTVGHSVCEQCRLKLQHCPNCRNQFLSARNYSLESLAKNAVYKCKKNMCTFIGNGEEILNHQQMHHTNSESRGGAIVLERSRLIARSPPRLFRSVENRSTGISNQKKCWIKICNIGDPSETFWITYNFQ